MNVLDLFSGIGGFSLGLERAGMRTVAFCEIDPFCRAVLKKHWPNVPIHGDIRSLTAETLAHAECTRPPRSRRNAQHESKVIESSDDSPEKRRIDLICGGFPCQDISVAGKGAGIEGSRSGLWSEYARIIGEVRPRYVIVENVAALLGRGLERVLGDLAALGFDAEWHCIPASAVGAPHRRDRVWIVGYANAERCGWRQDHEGQIQTERNGPSAPGYELADADSDNGEWRSAAMQMGRLRIEREIARHGDGGRTQWATEPNVGRVAHGVPARVDRLRSLGNAIVPQIAEIIGKAIMEMDEKPAPC